MNRAHPLLMSMLSAPKRSLLRCVNPSPFAPVKKSSVVKLADGNGAVLEVKRDGIVIKKHYANTAAWLSVVGTPGSTLFLQLPSVPKRAMR